MDFCPNLLLGKPQYILLHLLQKKNERSSILVHVCSPSNLYSLYRIQNVLLPTTEVN